MAVSDRRQAVAVGLVDPASRCQRAQRAGRLVAAARERLGADALVFEKPRQERLGLGEGLVARLSRRGRETIALVSPVVPEPRSNSAEGLQAADDLLLSAEQAQKLGAVIGLDQPQLALRQIEQIGK